MTGSEVATLGLSVVATLQVIVWIRLKEGVLATISGAFTLIYVYDLTNIAFTRVTFISGRAGLTEASSTAVDSSFYLVAIAWLAFTAVVGAARLRGGPTVGSQYESDVETVSSPPRGQTVRYLCVAVPLSLFLGGRILASGIEHTLLDRQEVFSGNLVASMGYYAIPVSVVAGALVFARVAGLRRLVCGLAVAAALCVTAITGSRTNLLIVCVAPVLALLWRRTASQRRAYSALGKRGLIILGFVAIPIIASFYLTSVRGVSNSNGLFQTADLSDADVLVGLEQAGVPHHHTYLSAVTWIVPRSVWPDKPLPGNVEASLVLAPARYLLQQVQTTSGLLGEGAINFGLAGAALAGLLLAFCTLFVRRLARSPSDAQWLFAVILVARVVTLVRGDVASTAPGVFAAVVIWAMAIGFRRSPERATETLPWSAHRPTGSPKSRSHAVTTNDTWVRV